MSNGLPPLPMQGQSPETRDALRDWELAALRKELTELRKEVEDFSREKDKAMKWGIMTLGAALLGMGSWIFNLIISHLPGAK